MTQDTITRTMTIEDIFRSFPQKSQRLAQEMTQSGLHCTGCSAATYETLEAGMYNHGMEEDEIEHLVERLNTILKEQDLTKPETLATVTITPAAAKKFQAILAEEKKEGWGLRFGERAAGCSGFEYFLDFSENAKSEDQLFESQGIKIHIHRNSVPRLLGCVIDYIDGLHGAGFKISNPNVKSSCGCGTSHGY